MFFFQPIVLCGAATAALLLYFLQVLYTAFTSPLRQIPGPWYSLFTHYVLKWKTMAGQRMHYVEALHRSYGSVVRISPWQVAVADPDGFAAIHRIGSGFLKTKWYEDFMGGIDPVNGIGIGMFAMTDVKAHSARRKLFARPFSLVSLRQNCEPMIREKVEKAVSRIHDEASSGISDVLMWWMLMATDVIAQLSFGESFGVLDAGKKNHYIEVLEATASCQTLQYEFPLLYYIGRLLPIKSLKTYFNSGRMLNTYGHQAIAKLRRHNDEKTLFSNISVEDNNEKSQYSLSDEDIRVEATDFIIAGTDTTANTLTYISWSVLKRPELHAKLQAELNTLGDDFNDSMLERLPLLNAVIQESLRLYGAVPGNLSRVVPPSGITIGQFFIPPGFEVETQAYSMHRNPDVYPDPLRFDETRWLDTDSVTPQQKACFCPFGAGTRVCVGMHLAKMELRLGTALLLKKCANLKLSKNMDDSMMEMYNFFLAGPVGKRCDVTLR